MLIILPRILRLILIIKKYKIQFVVSANYQSNLAAKICGIPNIVFNDDPRKGVIQIAKFSSDIVYMTKGFSIPGTVELNCLKEWAYLSPRYFRPDPSILIPLGLEPFSYLMLREVSTKTTNYSHQKSDQLINANIGDSKRVIISLEDKSKVSLVPKHWTILQEPLQDIHSLMFFAAAFVSTGDSMAREAAELGVPSFYAGSRQMIANEVLVKKGLLFSGTVDDIITHIESIEVPNLEREIEHRESIRMKLDSEWEDVNQIIKEHIKK
ncbi:MAG: hypothetical protein K9G46_13560 [Flavobacteriales bacterium]|nr:hypothetical protein [Flavobacteriales bacterium]